MQILDRVVEWIVGALLVVLVATAFGQVVARYAFGRPFTWVLELDMLLMVWAVFLSGYLGIRRDAHLRVAYFLDRMPSSARRRAILAGRALALAFVTVTGTTSFEIIRAMDGVEFTAIPLGMAALYWTLPVGAALMALALVEGLVRDWRAES